MSQDNVVLVIVIVWAVAAVDAPTVRGVAARDVTAVRPAAADSGLSKGMVAVVSAVSPERGCAVVPWRCASR